MTPTPTPLFRIPTITRGGLEFSCGQESNRGATKTITSEQIKMGFMYAEIATDNPIQLDAEFVRSVLDQHMAVVTQAQGGKKIRTGNASYAVTRPANISDWKLESS